MSTYRTEPQPLVDEARRIEEDALYSAKGHFEAAAGWGRWHLWIGIPMAVAAAAGGVTALSHQPEVSAALSFASATLGALFTFLNPNDRSAAHLKAGNAYKALSNDARLFWRIECGPGGSEKLSEKLKELNERRNGLNAESQPIPRWAYARARRGIEAGEAVYAVNARGEQTRPAEPGTAPDRRGS